MKKINLLFVVISLIVVTLGCTQKNEVTYKVFKRGYKFAIAKSDADTSTLKYEYTTVESLESCWDGGFDRGWTSVSLTYCYSNEYFKVSKGFEGYGLIKNDQLIIPAVYSDINCLNDGSEFWKAENKDGSESLFASNGKLVYHPINDIQIRFHEDTICYLDVADSIFAYAGEKLLGPFHWIGLYDSGKFKFKSCDSKKSGIISKYGEKIIEFPYEETEYPVCGLYCVRNGNINGIVDINGKVIVPLKEWECWLNIEADTTITYCEKNEWGFYDALGTKHKLSDKFPNLSLEGDFILGSAIVKDKKTGLYGLLSKTGKFILDCDFQNCIGSPSECQFKKNNVWALFNRKTGEVIRFFN